MGINALRGPAVKAKRLQGPYTVAYVEDGWPGTHRAAQSCLGARRPGRE